MTYKVKEALRLRNEMTEHLRQKKSKEEYRELDYRWEYLVSTMTIDEQKLYAQEVGR